MSFPNIMVKTKNFELTKTLRETLDKRLMSLERFLPKEEIDIICEVELEKITERHQAGRIYRAEVNMSFGGTLLRVEAVEETMETAIDHVKGEMKRELEKTHSRSKSLSRKGAREAKQILHP